MNLDTAPSAGRHNSQLDVSRDRLIKGGTYKNQRVIMVVPTRGVIPAKVVQSWMNLMTPMNQPFLRVFVEKMEVGEAYTTAIENILAHPELSKWEYVLTLEEDNIPPPDGILKLIETMQDKRKFAAVGGLYWTKGDGGQPMIYGHPGEGHFMPQVPRPGEIQECRGLGMGFTLFRLDVFKDSRLQKPWFKTVQEYTSGQGGKCFTQDLWFFQKIQELGYRVASDNRVLVGHYDIGGDIVW